MSKNKKKHIDYYRKDVHHICFQGRHWKQGYAKLLREHWYLKVRIPQMTLHRLIHSKIHDVPCPEGRDCKMAYLKLVELEQDGRLSENASVEERIQFLIDCWEDTCPATVAILKWQQDVARKFFFVATNIY